MFVKRWYYSNFSSWLFSKNRIEIILINVIKIFFSKFQVVKLLEDCLLCTILLTHECPTSWPDRVTVAICFLFLEVACLDKKLNFSFEMENSIELSLLINVNDIDMIPLLVVPLFKDIFLKADQAFWFNTCSINWK